MEKDEIPEAKLAPPKGSGVPPGGVTLGAVSLFTSMFVTGVAVTFTEFDTDFKETI